MNFGTVWTTKDSDVLKRGNLEQRGQKEREKRNRERERKRKRGKKSLNFFAFPKVAFARSSLKKLKLNRLKLGQKKQESDAKSGNKRNGNKKEGNSRNFSGYWKKSWGKERENLREEYPKVTKLHRIWNT